MIQCIVPPLRGHAVLDGPRMVPCMTRGELREIWSARQAEWLQFTAQVDGAKVVAAFLADFDSVTGSEREEALSLAEAARISGYSREHLARLIRAGSIVNAGEKNRPRIRRKDVPHKPHFSLASGTGFRYDAHADARSLRERQGER
jgi:hypothetical protein